MKEIAVGVRDSIGIGRTEGSNVREGKKEKSPWQVFLSHLRPGPSGLPFPGAIGVPTHKDSRKIYGAASDSFSTRAPTENNGSASSGHY